MVNEFSKNIIITNNEAVLNIESAATLLSISTATVRNWVKCGYLQTFGETKSCFNKKDIEDVKSKIISGHIEKLSKRANKAKADRTFAPDEYIQDKAGFSDFNSIIEFIKSNKIDLSLSLFLVGLNILKQENILADFDIQNIIQNKKLSFTNKQIEKEIKSWLLEIENKEIKKAYSFLIDCDIPKQRDILGLLYQSLLLEGQKSKSGSYYTPAEIVDEIIGKYVKKDSKVLDPCCGTGQFLLAFSEKIENPANIYGFDIDKIAVQIARLNILIKFKNKDFSPNIFCKNTLLDVGTRDLFSIRDSNIKDFDVIATNPPWGAHFSKGESEQLKGVCPEISSLESFSYFLKKSIDLLNEGGVISFILPESILNVKTHKDIREIILKNTQIKKICYLDRVFKNVFTPVIRMDLEKIKSENNKIEICKESESYKIDQKRWLNNQDFVFDIHTNRFDAEIINKIYKIKHETLENKAEWALGIVTGNNKQFISDEQKAGFEPIYKGKDVGRLILNSPSNYIHFTPEKFQQVASVEKYRTKEKLIYRFISKKLVFAYDDKQQLTLNSANIIIPKIPDYPMKVIAALFNSSAYQFIFQKKFSSIKVLRSHIEQMPLPLWDKKVFSKIGDFADKVIKDKGSFEELDNYILDNFCLLPEEKNYIKEFNK